jgi:hypothetical protein
MMNIMEVVMPTVKGIPGPYRFFFYSFDCNEPEHIHVQRDRQICKFWLDPLSLERNHGFSPQELNRIRVLIQHHLPILLEAWDEHCGA